MRAPHSPARTLPQALVDHPKPPRQFTSQSCHDVEEQDYLYQVEDDEEKWPLDGPLERMTYLLDGSFTEHPSELRQEEVYQEPFEEQVGRTRWETFHSG